MGVCHAAYAQEGNTLMNTQNRADASPVQIRADHASEKRLGNWTTARAFQVRARHAQIVIDLRSPQIPDGDIGLDLELDHAAVKLLVAENAVIDQRDLAWTGRGKVKQTYHNPASAGRRIRLTGQVRRGEIRVHSGGTCPAVGDRVTRVPDGRAPRPR